MNIDWSLLKTAEQKEEELLKQAREAKYAENNSKYTETTVSITKNYPQEEKDTWPTQEKEVKAWQSDPVNALTPWIDAASSVRGISREEYLQRTLQKTLQFEQISAHLTGLRQRYEDQIKRATTKEQLEAIEILYNLPEGVV